MFGIASFISFQKRSELLDKCFGVPREKTGGERFSSLFLRSLFSENDFFHGAKKTGAQSVADPDEIFSWRNSVNSEGKFNLFVLVHSSQTCRTFSID